MKNLPTCCLLMLNIADGGASCDAVDDEEKGVDKEQAVDDEASAVQKGDHKEQAVSAVQKEDDKEQDKDEKEQDDEFVSRKVAVQEGDDKKQDDDEKEKDDEFVSLLPRITRHLFLFDSMNCHARKHRKAFLECLVSCEDHGITLKKYDPKMCYPLHMMNECFFYTLEKKILRMRTIY